MSRLRFSLPLMLLLLAACDQSTPVGPTPVPATATAEAANFTPGPENTPAATVVLPSPTSPGVFVIPTEEVTPTAEPVVIATPGGSGGLGIDREVNDYFIQFYQGRTLTDGFFDIELARNLTDEPYRDYTVSLLQKDMDAVNAGELVAVNYSDIRVNLDEWQPRENGAGTAFVTVSRTKHETRKGAQPSTTTSTDLRFKLERRVIDIGVTWVAVDFYNPASGQWISEHVPPPTGDVADEIQDYFEEFYAARTLLPGGRFDLEKTAQITEFAYQEYTMPLLERQQEEADQGKLTEVSYSDIRAEVVNWFPQATSHGGIATVKVTRTSNIVRPSGAEAPQTGTYEFRVHRHWDESDRGIWIAVDFFSPISNKWVSESAGLSGPVPPTGHG